MLPSETTAVAGTEVCAPGAYGLVGVRSECAGLSWVTSGRFSVLVIFKALGWMESGRDRV